MFRIRTVRCFTTFLISTVVCITAVVTTAFTGTQMAIASTDDITVDGGLRGEHIEARVKVGTPPRSNDDCRWEKAEWTDALHQQYSTLTEVTPPEGSGYSAYIKSCTQPKQELSLYWIHRSVFRTLSTAAENALDKLIPKPITNFAPVTDRFVVNVGTWFWIDKSAWKTISVTAFVPTKAGTVSAKTSATPKKIIFSPGDGRFGSGEVTCTGPGSPWRPRSGDTSTSSCMYTYRRASHGQQRGVYNAKLSIEWDISVKMSLGGTRLGISGKVGTTRTSISIPVRVREIQGLTR